MRSQECVYVTNGLFDLVNTEQEVAVVDRRVYLFYNLMSFGNQRSCITSLCVCVCVCVCVCPGTAGCVLPRSETTTVQSGWAPAGVKAALNGSISHVCSAGSTRRRRETAEEPSAVHNVALNTTSPFPRWVSDALQHGAFSQSLVSCVEGKNWSQI